MLKFLGASLTSETYEGDVENCLELALKRGLTLARANYKLIEMHGGVPIYDMTRITGFEFSPSGLLIKSRDAWAITLPKE